MQENLTNTMYIDDPEKWCRVMLSGVHDVRSWYLIDDDTIAVQYRSMEDHIDVNPTTNVVIAAMTTCHARLHLLEYMEQVEDAKPDRLLYFGGYSPYIFPHGFLIDLYFTDTDSIIFVSEPGVADPPTGKFLGQLTDELKPGQHIEEFASLGPKSYALRYNDGTQSVKAKGQTLNGITSQLINFESYLSMLETKSVVTVPYANLILRNKRKLQLEEIPQQSKRIRYTYDKRRLLPGTFHTRPFGFSE